MRSTNSRTNRNCQERSPQIFSSFPRVRLAQIRSSLFKFANVGTYICSSFQILALGRNPFFLQRYDLTLRKADNVELLDAGKVWAALVD